MRSVVPLQGFMAALQPSHSVCRGAIVIRSASGRSLSVSSGVARLSCADVAHGERVRPH